MTQTVIGVFDTPDTAYSAGDALVEQGVDQSSIYFSAKEGTEAATGLTGQPMDAIRGFLSDLFGPENSQDADYYVEEISRGGVLLSVDVSDDINIEPICEVLQDAGAVDIDARRAELEGSESASAGKYQEKTRSVPVVEEQMEIGKRQVGKGKVRVVSRTVATPVQENVTLREEYATINRRRADRPINPEDINAEGEESIEVEETAEKAVVGKSARVVAEVELGKETRDRTETIEDTVRHTEVEVERTPSDRTKGQGKKR